MKKLITLLLVLMMVLALASCGSSQTAEANEEPKEVEETTDIEEEIPTEDLVAVEAIVFMPALDTVGFIPMDITIRNLTDEKQERMEVNYQVLDKNGDVIENSLVYLENIQPGQAGTYHGAVPGQYEDFGAMAFYNYTLYENSLPHDIDFIKPLTFVEGETIVKNGDAAYSWVPGDIN